MWYLSVTHRSAFNRSVGIAVGTAVPLAYTSAAWAYDASSYFPLRVGDSRTYDVERRLIVSSGLERIERYMEGWAEEEVIGMSPLSTAGTVVYKVRRRIALGDVGTTPIVNWDFVLHLSSAKNSVRIHGYDSEALKGGPAYFLGRDPPFNEKTTFWYGLDDQLAAAGELVAIEQLGKIRQEIGLISQTTEAVKVPAGSFRRTVKNVLEGSLFGELGGAEIRVGRVSLTDWFAKGVGPVRTHSSHYIKVRAPEGPSITITQTETRRLTSYKLPRRGMRDE